MLKINKFLTVFLVFAFSIGKAQQLIYSDSTQLLSASTAVNYFIDNTNTLTFDDLRQKTAESFTKNQNKGMSFGNTTATFWFRLSLKNKANQDLYLLLRNHETWNVDVYCISENNQVITSKAGLFRPVSGRFFKTNVPAFNLGKTPKEVFIKAKTPIMYFPIEVGTIQPLMQDTHDVDFFHGLLLGMMLSLAIYNFVVFLYVKDTLFLSYTLYVLPSIYLIARAKGYINEWFLHHVPFLQNENNVASSLMILGAFWFTTKFLNTKALAPYFHRWITFLMGLGIAFLVTEFFSYQPWFNDFYQILYIILFLSFLFGGIYIYFLGYKPAKYYVIGFSFFLTGFILVLLAYIGVLPSNKIYTFYGYQIGAAIEAIIFSFAIANRFETYRQEAKSTQSLALQRAEENEKILAEHNQLLAEKMTLEQKGKTKNEAIFLRKRLQKLSIPTLEGVLLLPMQDIVRFEAMGSYCTIYLSNQKKIVASRPVAHFEPQLDNEDFFRIHKSHLVNIHQVERYIRGEGGSVIMNDGSEVGVSRQLKQELLTRLAIN